MVVIYYLITSLADLLYDLQKMIAGHIAISLENGFQRSKITLPPQKFAFKIGRRGSPCRLVALM